MLLICAIFTASEKMEILRKNSPDHNFLLFFGHGDFEYCITAYFHANLVILGQVLHGLHDHARQGGCGNDPPPDSRPDGGHA